MLLKVYCSSFSAAPACTFNEPMIDFLRNKDNRLNGQHLLSSAINKKKREHGKYNVEVKSEQYII